MKKKFAKKSRNSFQDNFNVPKELRVRIVKIVQHLIEEIVVNCPIGDPFGSPKDEFYPRVHESLCYHFGVLDLGYSRNNAEEDLLNFLLNTEDIEKLLQTVQCLFQFVDKLIQDFPIEPHIKCFSKMIMELNRNFDEFGIGHQFESGRIIPVDSQFMYQKIIKPVLTILTDPMYKGANAEFLSAYDHYQAARYKESMNECLKAFESCMKSICEKRKWNYNQTDAAKKLIDILFNERLFPKYMQSQYNGVRSVLQDGIPTMRNKQSGHGQGPNVVPVPKHMAQYALNLTATNIIFLANLERDKR